VSALGVARAAGLVPRIEEIVIRIQREMFVAGAELATGDGNESKLKPGISKVTPEMAQEAERDIDELLTAHPLPQEFLLPGETPGSAALDLARSIIRRAERQAVAMDRANLVKDPEVLRYLNRVSDLLYACARYEEGERGRSARPSRER
jgi:cob(I)alamin adenosyltransferase